VTRVLIEFGVLFTNVALVRTIVAPFLQTQLPNWSSLRLDASCSGRLPIRVGALVPLIRAAAANNNKIQELVLGYLKLSGTMEEWEELRQCIQMGLSALETLEIHKMVCSVVDGWEDSLDGSEDNSFDDVLMKSCCAIPTLRKISIQFWGSFPQATLLIVQCQNLTELHLPNVHLSDDCILAFCYSHMEQSNLQTLTMFAYNLQNPHACGKAMAHYLEQTTTLQKFAINASDSANVSEFFAQVLDGMKRNSSIVRLEIDPTNWKLPGFPEAFRSMAEANVSLTYIKNISYCGCLNDWSRAAKFYVALNAQCGRSQVLGYHHHKRKATNEEWITVMLRAYENILHPPYRWNNGNQENAQLSVLVYFLTQNPTLIERLADNRKATTLLSRPSAS
jgi:hypothetical protein